MAERPSGEEFWRVADEVMGVDIHFLDEPAVEPRAGREAAKGRRPFLLVSIA